MTRKKPTYVYVAGPISNDTIGSVRRAINVSRALDAGGCSCYVPHLSVLAEMVAPRDYEDWMELDFAWLKRCDALFRLPGDSPGADREVEEARRLHIPVFVLASDLFRWMAEREALENG